MDDEYDEYDEYDDEQLGDGGGDEYKGYDEEPTHVPQSLEMEPTPPIQPSQPGSQTEHAPNKRNNKNIQNTPNEYFIISSNIIQECIERYWRLRQHQEISYQEPKIGDIYYVNGIEIFVCSMEMIRM